MNSRDKFPLTRNQLERTVSTIVDEASLMARDLQEALAREEAIDPKGAAFKIAVVRGRSQNMTCMLQDVVKYSKKLSKLWISQKEAMNETRS
jgi:hypothetical protein